MDGPDTWIGALRFALIFPPSAAAFGIEEYVTEEHPRQSESMIRVTHFMRRAAANQRSIERLFEDVRDHLPSDCKVTVHTCHNLSTGLWGRLKDIWRASSHLGDVNHVTGDVHYLTYLLGRRRTILTIHDLNILNRHCGLRRWIFWLLWYWLPVRLSRVVTVISESTRADLLRHVRCDPEKVYVVPNSVSAEFTPSEKPFDADCPRVLQIGTGWNKNLERVAEALAGITCKLIVIGRLSEHQTAVLNHHAIDYENYVGISREELVQQYAACDLVVFASTYEGFGLPIVEAQAIGRPVVTSNVTSMPEVAGDAACIVDPRCVGDIRTGVRRVIDDAHYRRNLVRAGFKNAARFSANAIAQRYGQIYRQVAQQ